MRAENITGILQKHDKPTNQPNLLDDQHYADDAMK